MKPTSQSVKASVEQGLECVAIDYSYLVDKDPKGKPIYQGVRYTRVGSVSESEAIKRGYERDEYMDRRERVRKAKLAAVSGVNQESAT